MTSLVVPEEKSSNCDAKKEHASTNANTSLTANELRDKELHIAPLLDYSKHEFRKLFSILSTRVTVWTDMAVDETVVHSQRLPDLVGVAQSNLPNRQICQIGGSSPELCSQAVRIVTNHPYDYDEVNLNMDCPSPRVSHEREFGARLMTKVQVAYHVLESMQQQNSKKKPISVKCRIGVDDNDDLEFISDMIQCLLPVCTRFYLHARRVVLNQNFNARKNRSVPPLNYPRVYELCHRFPQAQFWINGGIRTLSDAKAICYGMMQEDDDNDDEEKECSHESRHQVPCTICNFPNGSCTAPPSPSPPTNLRGVMMGRAAIDNPSLFARADTDFFGLGHNPCRTRRQVLERYCHYLETELYPRRCCDDDPRMTYQIPAPQIQHYTAAHCEICYDVYCGDKDDDSPVAPSSSTIKFSSRLIGRALKPVRGMFYGLPHGVHKAFVRACDDLSHNRRLCNCGPGCLLRMAIRTIDASEGGKLGLDQEF